MLFRNRKLFFVFVFFSMMNFGLLLRSVVRTNRPGQSILLQLQAGDVNLSFRNILCNPPASIPLDQIPAEGVEIRFFGDNHRFVIYGGVYIRDPIINLDVFECAGYDVYDGGDLLFRNRPALNGTVFHIYVGEPNFQETFLRALPNITPGITEMVTIRY